MNRPRWRLRRGAPGEEAPSNRLTASFLAPWIGAQRDGSPENAGTEDADTDATDARGSATSGEARLPAPREHSEQREPDRQDQHADDDLTTLAAMMSMDDLAQLAALTADDHRPGSPDLEEPPPVTWATTHRVAHATVPGSGVPVALSTVLPFLGWSISRRVRQRPRPALAEPTDSTGSATAPAATVGSPVLTPRSVRQHRATPRAEGPHSRTEEPASHEHDAEPGSGEDGPESDADPAPEGGIALMDWLSSSETSTAVRRERRRRWAVPLAALVTLLLVGLAVFVGLWRSGEPADAPAAGASPTALTPTPALRGVGSFTQARVRADGTVRVSQWLQAERPFTSVRLRLPAGTGDDPAGTSVFATELRVVPDGDAPENVNARITGLSPRSFYFAPSTLVHLTYRLHNAVQISPENPDRAFVRVTALDVRNSFSTGPRTVRVVGGDVLAMGCTTITPSGAPNPRSCGAPRGKGWQVELTDAQTDDVVTAQIDLTD